MSETKNDVEVPTRHIPTREEILEDSGHWMTHKLISEVYEELLICKALIDDKMNHSGWDSSYFDVDIDLKVRFGNSIVRVHESWEALEP